MTKPVANGVRKGVKRQFHMALDQDTFAIVKARAIQERTSLAEQVRLLVEWGLEATTN